MQDKLTAKEAIQRIRMTIIALTNWPCTYLGWDDREWLEMAMAAMEREAVREDTRRV